MVVVPTMSAMVIMSSMAVVIVTVTTCVVSFIVRAMTVVFIVTVCGHERSPKFSVRQCTAGAPFGDA